MLYKNQIILFFIFSIAFSVFIALLNYTVDPFQQYRKATFYQAPYINGRYLNAGMAKNFSYDSLIIGTSMTENFRIAEITEMLSFSKPIKLTVGGGSIFDESTILKTAIDTGRVKNVLFGLDIFCLKANPESYPLPGYLYDHDAFNDYHYLFNLDTLKRSLTYPFFQLLFKNHPRMDYARMYEWQHNVADQQFDAIKVLNDYQVQRTRFATNFPEKTSSFQYMKDNFDKILLPVIRENSRIHYHIFYPPYSILEYKLLAENRQLESYIKIKTYISKQLLQLTNVTLFDFQAKKAITHHLDNYMDARHYHQRLNHWMLEQMKASRFKVTNPQENADEFRRQVIHYSLQTP